MTDILIFFIGASLLLYVVLGGSDYGAGILELLPAGRLRQRQQHVIDSAMGPVWEANHMWLILVVVILFVGFPPIFTTLMTALHLPMLALLTGIVVRGSAFTFRHYDAVRTPRPQRVYTVLFSVSSLWTAVWLGIIVASLNRGLIVTHAGSGWSAYIGPWWGLYPLSVGVFVACIFTFLASTYLGGETKDEDLRRRFLRLGTIFNFATIVSGGLVFLASYGEKTSLPALFMAKPVTFVVMAAATAMFLLLRVLIKTRHPMPARFAAAAQVGLILTGWWILYAPDAILTTDGPLNFHREAAPEATLRQLVIALFIGSLFIFPSLIFLLKVFKSGPPGEEAHDA